jgi:hypothetical protein
MTFVIIAALLGITAAALATKGAWAHAMLAGLLALAAIYVAAEPPTQLVVREQS